MECSVVGRNVDVEDDEEMERREGHADFIVSVFSGVETWVVLESFPVQDSFPEHETLHFAC
jgi:hypothetical protein